MFISNLNMRNKLFMLIGSAIISFMILLSFALVTIRKIEIGSRLYKELKNHHIGLGKIAMLQNSIAEIRILSITMLTVTDKWELEQIRNEINDRAKALNADFNESITLLKEIGDDNEEREGVILAINSAWFTWNEFFKVLKKEYFKLFSPADIDKARKLAEGKLRLMQNRFVEQLESAVNTMNLDIEVHEENAKTIAREMVFRFILGSAILFLGVLFFTLILSNSMTKPLLALVEATKLVIAGDLTLKAKVTSKDEIGRLTESFNVMTENLKNSREELQRSYGIQSVLYLILCSSFEKRTLEELLEISLELVLSLPWFVFEPMGAIFTIGADSETLELRAQKGLPEILKKTCARVSFGDCLCGLAASEKKVQFVDHIDERHRITYEGIEPHGHYCVPLNFGDTTLGVMSIFVNEGHIYDENEEKFLTLVSHTLAGIIARMQAQENLKKSYIRLSMMQDQLIQAEKLNALGQLASGVAHEVRNPLAIIQQGVNYLEKKVSSEEKDTLEVLVLIKDNIKRADKIIDELFNFSKAARLYLQPEDINSILEESLSLVKGRLRFENIGIITETKKDIPKIRADKNKMEQVFINILLNAIQAMPEGGKIIIRAYEKQLEEEKNGIGRRKEDYFLAGEKAVIVEIEDTGVGITEENLKRIFDPFFTTKGPRGGAGLGLAVSRNIIFMHKGLLDVESQVGKGTKIIMTLKIAEG